MSSAIEIDNSSEAVGGGVALGAAPDLRLPALPTELPLSRRKGSGPARLSFAQERLWFLDQISPGDVLANLSSGVRIKGTLNTDALKQALRAVVARHEILRTTFAKNEHHAGTDGQPMQWVAETSAIELVLTDLSQAPQAEREEEARKAAHAEARKPFDLTLGPLLRPVLLKLHDSDHILLLNSHRIVADELSLGIFFSELWQCYQAFVNHADAGLDELSVQFSDYAAWQRVCLQGAAFKQQLDYWQAALAGAPSVLELPTDKPRGTVQTSHGASCSLLLERELTGQLKAIAEHSQAPLEAVVLASCQILLARYSRQSDIVVGLQSANRDGEGTAALIGPFENALVLRTDLSNSPTFAELLARTTDATRQAQAHQSMPFARLLEELPIERSLSHPPVFQVLVTFKRTDAVRTGADRFVSTGAQAIAPLQVEPFDFETGISPYDLTLNVVEAANQIRLRLEYNTDLFIEDTAARLLEHFEVLLKGIGANPNQRIDRLPLLTEKERQQLLVGWNDTQVEFPQGLCVHELFESQVEKTPGAIALVQGNDRLSYRELNARANQLAHHLRRLGVRAEERVAVCLERSTDLVIAVLATLKAGGTYVPLDPAYPPERLAFTMNDAAAAILLTQENLVSLLAETTARVICVDREQEDIAREDPANLVSVATARNLAYVIYTSGSTGQPKGVAIEHTSTVTFLRWAISTFTAEELSGVLFSTSLCFDLSVFEFFAPLCTGGKVILVENALQLPALHSDEVTLINTVPSAMAELVSLKAIPASVRTVNLAGEPLAKSLVQAIYQQESVSQVLNLYGPSEDTTYSTFVRLAKGAKDEPTIGRPVTNTQVYLLDANFQPAPIGVPGELCLGGSGLARGYLNRGDLTAEKFVPDPFGPVAGARLYRTGDLARYKNDGNIEFLGRIDHQVKIRGFRIELGEVEATLRTHPAVRDAAVLPKESNDGLVAYVVVEREQLSSQATIAGELRKHLGNTLPDYMVPSIFVELEALPLTPSGKVNRRALSVPEAYRPESSVEHVAPRNEVEATLVNLWQKVLGLKSVGVKDNFFELGGHSLLASRLFAQIQNTFGRNLPLAVLFQSPTVEQLAAVLREHDSPRSWSSLVAIQPQGSRPPLFCVHAAGANVLIYRPLARHLGMDQPVYALQARGLDGHTAPLVRVEDMAAHYIKEMRTVQKEGPYLLLGASFGGLVIYEMAQQLLAQGQQVALLVMLNTDCPVYSVAKRIRCHLGNLMKKGPRTYFAFAARSMLRRLSLKTEEKIAETLAGNEELQAAIESRPDPSDPLVRTVLANLQAENDYTPAQRNYQGKIVYFWARDAEVDFQDNRAGWRRLAAGEFELHVVAGDHGTMREEPNIAVLVEKLKPAL